MMDELQQRLQKAASIKEKIAILDACPQVQTIFLGFSFLELSLESEYVIKQMIAIGQLQRFALVFAKEPNVLEALVEKLMPIDTFYQEMGGIVGYHETVLTLLKKQSEPSCLTQERKFHSPCFTDISAGGCDESVARAIFWGLEALPQLCEIYPLGGAADRLHLVDPESGSELPAAKLLFAGMTLFERLVRDLQAREYLYYKLYQVQLATPIAVMTSLEKNNYQHVLAIAKEKSWFDRPSSLFRFFIQPLVPVVDSHGNWCIDSGLHPLLKPGGHGAIWKLARDEGIFTWFRSLGKRKILVRQINNPAAGLDYGLLAFAGIGCKGDMSFGFASCPRLVGAAEGVNVLVESSEGEKNRIVLTNIEYCDFAKFGIQDAPLRQGSCYSRFSSNTNILFADLAAIEDAVRVCPFPGLLINLKNRVVPSLDGKLQEEKIARLESTMQNIADVFVEEKGESLATQKTFITYNHRHKTISTAKKAYTPGGSLQETPENCFYELMGSAREVLSEACLFTLPLRRSIADFLHLGPDLVFLYHPALGPLYSVIGQKLRQGRISLGSELNLQIADVDLELLDLSGSLCIFADQVMGHKNEEGHLVYSERTGRCRLRRVTVRNQGVDWETSRPFWKGSFQRLSSLEIHLRGYSEFVAEDVVFEGKLRFEVRPGTRLRVTMKEGRLISKEEPLDLQGVEPFWRYQKAKSENGDEKLRLG